MLMLMPYLGPSWALGPRRASAALKGTRGHYVGVAQDKEGAAGSHD